MSLHEKFEFYVRGNKNESKDWRAFGEGVVSNRGMHRNTEYYAIVRDHSTGHGTLLGYRYSSDNVTRSSAGLCE